MSETSVSVSVSAETKKTAFGRPVFPREIYSIADCVVCFACTRLPQTRCSTMSFHYRDLSPGTSPCSSRIAVPTPIKLRTRPFRCRRAARSRSLTTGHTALAVSNVQWCDRLGHSSPCMSAAVISNGSSDTRRGNNMGCQQRRGHEAFNLSSQLE